MACGPYCPYAWKGENITSITGATCFCGPSQPTKRPTDHMIDRLKRILVFCLMLVLRERESDGEMERGVSNTCSESLCVCVEVLRLFLD